MPRKGYVTLTITAEAKIYLEILRKILNQKSYSDAIITSAEIIRELENVVRLINNAKKSK